MELFFLCSTQHLTRSLRSLVSYRFPYLRAPMYNSLYNVSRDENPQIGNVWTFEGFHAQLDCKLKYGNKNQTQLTLT